MNGYKAFWMGREVEVHAETSYAAQAEAARKFQGMAGRKKVRQYEVTVFLCEKDGETVVHDTTEVG